MRKPKQADPSGETLIKYELASSLRQEIVNGALLPGVRIVEGTWARKFSVAQGSIREAINILAQEGFVTKAAGRSARVVSFSEEDVLDLYALRGALEGVAARLAAEKKPDTGLLERALAAMRVAATRDKGEDLLDSDLAFHLELCRLSGNSYIVDHARRVLLPFFAFVRIRLIASGQGTGAWGRDLEAHQRIIDLLNEGEGDVVEQYVRRVMARFSTTAYKNWEKKPMLSTRSGR
ncbi:GntR family transcriptional regulator [Granulicella arctica]|uniref:GntR family transcriptional regulator n=1 Tax=Granulicella arctica TaxID=940613 RepID=UPI0021E067C0|nr:GntR family transcriptional regulator [Granulicella arctica]